MRKDVKLKSMIQGGGQERQMRGGTENLYGIIGLAKHLTWRTPIWTDTSSRTRFEGLYERGAAQVFPGIGFNGDI